MNYLDKMDELQNNAEFLQAMTMAETSEELQALLKNYGVELSLEQIREMVASVGAEPYGELSEEALENVTGGGFVRNLFKKLLRKSIDKSTRDFKKLNGR